MGAPNTVDWAGFIGQKFNRLTVTRIVSIDKKYNRIAAAICDCGNTVTVRLDHIRDGFSKSCGCMNPNGRKHESHGYVGTLTYSSWQNMKNRCNNESVGRNYKNYGGRGITYEPRWEVFSEFLQDMGESPGAEYSIDRIDGDGNYTKENCEWRTQLEQMQHTARSNNITIDGVTKTLAQWKRDLDIRSNSPSIAFIEREYRKTGERKQPTPKFKLPLELIVNASKSESEPN